MYSKEKKTATVWDLLFDHSREYSQICASNPWFWYKGSLGRQRFWKRRVIY